MALRPAYFGGRGTYNLSAGSLISPSTEYVGNGGNGMFNQSGGTNTITSGSLGAFLGLETAGFILAYDGSSTSTYSLSGGALAVTGAEVIGFYGSGTFTQSAGTNTIAGGNELDLGVGYDGLSGVGSGTYTLSGGTVYASGNVVVGGSTRAAPAAPAR